MSETTSKKVSPTFKETWEKVKNDSYTTYMNIKTSKHSWKFWSTEVERGDDCFKHLTEVYHKQLCTDNGTGDLLNSSNGLTAGINIKFWQSYEKHCISEFSKQFVSYCVNTEELHSSEPITENHPEL